MKTEDLIGLLLLAAFAFFLITERLWPARQFPPIRGWTWIGIACLVLAVVVATVVPLLLPVGWIAEHSLLPGHRLGVIGGVLVGYPVVTLVGALVHRTLHASNFLWRWVHQLHHSPVRVDIPGSVLFHPFDLIQNNVVSLAVTVGLLGLDPEAAAWTGFVAVIYGYFQHWNVRTPRWLGYVIQRPESHGVHHTRNLHAWNYSDFPLWDMVMGTFRNPERCDAPAGFDGDAPKRVVAMLGGRDVNPALTNGQGATAV